MDTISTTSSPALPASVKEVIALWPTRQVCADDLGVTKARVDKWAQVGAIPARYHRRIIAAGRVRGFTAITADLLVDLHAETQIPGVA